MATPTCWKGWMGGRMTQAGSAGRARGVQCSPPSLGRAGGAHLAKLKFCPAFTCNFWHACMSGMVLVGGSGTRANGRPNEAVLRVISLEHARMRNLYRF